MPNFLDQGDVSFCGGAEAAATLAVALDDILMALADSDVATFANVGFEKIGGLAVDGSLLEACTSDPETAARLSSSLEALKPRLCDELPEVEEREIGRLIDAVKQLLYANDDPFGQDRILCLGLLKARLTEVVIREQLKTRSDPFQIFVVNAQHANVRH